MERLIWNAYTQLERDSHCFLVGPKGCKQYVSDPGDALECPSGSILGFLFIALFKCILASKTRRPRLLIAGSGVTAPLIVLAGRIWNIPTLTFVHGLDLIADSRLYQSIFLPAIAHSTTVIANSRNTAKLARAK